jgi:hypothetical protein
MQRKKREEKLGSGRAEESLKIYLKIRYLCKMGVNYVEDAY